MASDDAPAAPNPLLKFALDLGPLILFFVAFKRWDLVTATGVLMPAMLISLLATRVLEKRWPTMQLVSTLLVLVFGTVTLLLRDPTFIKLKVTAINAGFGVTLLIGLLSGRSFLKLMLGEAVQITEAGWSLMTKLWIGYFFALAIANELIWRNFSEDFWVKFKTFGLFGVTLVFLVVQAPIIAKHQMPEEPAEAE